MFNCLFYVCECFVEGIYQVFHVFRTYAEADGRGVDVLLFEFLGRELRVGSGGRMDNQALYVGHICQEREDSKVIDEYPCLLFTALYLESEDGSAAVGE